MAQTDFFLKIDGIDGESKDDKLGKQLQISSWSFGASNSGSAGLGGGMGSGKVSLQDFHFVVDNSKASANLFVACASGEHIKEATLTCRKPTGKDGGQMPYLIVTFTDIVVSSYQTGAGGGGIIAQDQISFNFTKIKMETKEQDEKGIIKSGGVGGWDTKTNKKV